VKKIIRRKSHSCSGRLNPSLLARNGFFSDGQFLHASTNSTHKNNESRARGHKDKESKTRNKTSSTSRERDGGSETKRTHPGGGGSGSIGIGTHERHYRRHSCGDMSSLLLFFAPFAASPMYFEFLPELSKEVLSEWALPHPDVDVFGCNEKVADRYRIILGSLSLDVNVFCVVFVLILCCISLILIILVYLS
jgi:hypothetical protein